MFSPMPHVFVVLSEFNLLTCDSYFTSLVEVFMNIFQQKTHFTYRNTRTQIWEAVVQRCSVKKLFLEILQNSQENTAACSFVKKETLAQVFSCEFCAIFKNTFFHRTSLVAAFDDYGLEDLNKHQIIEHKNILIDDHSFLIEQKLCKYHFLRSRK